MHRTLSNIKNEKQTSLPNEFIISLNNTINCQQTHPYDKLLKSAGISLTYANVLQHAQDIDSYTTTTSFLHIHCSILDSGFGLSSEKMNTLTETLRDLQQKNEKNIMIHQNNSAFINKMQDDNKKLETLINNITRVRHNKDIESLDRAITSASTISDILKAKITLDAFQAVIQLFKD